MGCRFNANTSRHVIPFPGGPGNQRLSETPPVSALVGGGGAGGSHAPEKSFREKARPPSQELRRPRGGVGSVDQGCLSPGSPNPTPHPRIPPNQALERRMAGAGKFCCRWHVPRPPIRPLTSRLPDSRSTCAPLQGALVNVPRHAPAPAQIHRVGAPLDGASVPAHTLAPVAPHPAPPWV